MIAVQNIKKSFGKTAAVDDLSFDIQGGEVVGFLGPNGAGKSTTMRIMTGYLSADAGRVTINGIDVAKDPLAAQKIIGYLPESNALYPDLYVIDYLYFMAGMRKMPQHIINARLAHVVDKCSLQTVLQKKISDLSKGFKQRVGLAQALLHDPQVLILDEPTIGLDPNQIVEIRNLILQIGKTKTVLLSSHILSEIAQTCERMLVINQGKLVAAGTTETLSQSLAAQSHYHVNIKGPLNVIEQQIAQLPHFSKLELLKSANDWHHCYLTSDSAADIGESIFNMVVKNNWQLSLLQREKITLEEVFKNLTH